MKKLLSLLLCAVLAFGALTFAACGGKTEKEPDKEAGSVNVKYYLSAAELMPMLKKGDQSIGLLPEPAATKLEKQLAADKTWYRLDLQELYDGEAKAYPQAVIMVKESLLKSYPSLSNMIQAGLLTVSDWLKNNTQSAVTAVNSKLEEGVAPSLDAKSLSAEVIDNCKIAFKPASAACDYVINYISDMRSIVSEVAAEVKDDFFYNGTAAGDFESDSIKIFMPDGAPALGMAKFIADNENFGIENKNVKYTVVAADKIGQKMVQGEGDIIVMPVTAASKLYSAKKYKMIGVLTNGNLYIMSTVKLTVAELKDKTMGVIGQGAVPDVTLKAVLKKHNLGVVVAN